jgi:hypothetical protein
MAATTTTATETQKLPASFVPMPIPEVYGRQA